MYENACRDSGWVACPTSGALPGYSTNMFGVPTGTLLRPDPRHKDTAENPHFRNNSS